MPFPVVDPGFVGPGMPLDTSNMEALFKGQNKTNGFLMKNVDGRVPALQQPVGRFSVDAANVLGVDGVVTWGNGLWRDISRFEDMSGIAHAQKPEKSRLAGVLKFNQGWQAGHPVMPHGAPSYSKGVIISKGLVGYKTAMTAVGQEESYLAFLKGDAAQNVPVVRTTYKEWGAAFAAAGDGAKLALFVANDSGFPIVVVVEAEDQAEPVLAGATFVGFDSGVWERENSAVYFDINL